MDSGLLSILAIGLVLGIKHAIEPDHIIAVSTIASRTKSLWKSSLAGIFWGIGHTLTLFIVGIIIILMKYEIEEKWAMSFEFIVGVMLVYLGISTILAFKKKKIHSHADTGNNRNEVSYLKSTIIGFVHGLAGSAAMVILTMGTVSTISEGALYIIVFGFGTCLGMLMFTTAVGISVIASSKKANIHKGITQFTGLVSIVFGMYYMYNLGFTEGLFRLWIQ
jgi:sulfite exporter TauE/SafE